MTARNDAGMRHHERTPLLKPDALSEADNLRQLHDVQSPTQKPRNLSATSPIFWVLVVSYSSVLFLNTANATALTTIYGKVAESFDAYQSAATWLNASYMIASACTNPLVGRLATLFRPTSLFLVCTLLFTTGAAITGVASSLDMFLVGRVIAGCGGAGLFTTCNILLLEGAPEKRRGVLIGIINAVMTVGSCLGPVIAGALSTSSWGWRPTFLFQVPISITATVCIHWFSPTAEAKFGGFTLIDKIKMIDWFGIVSLTAGLVLLLQATVAPVFSPIELLSGGSVLLVFAIGEANFAQLPIIPMRTLLHFPTFFNSLSTMCTMGARWAVLFYAPIWSIAVLGFHPAKAGAVLIPASIGFGLGGVLVGWISVRSSRRYYLQSLASIALFACTYVAFIRLPTAASQTTYALLLVANGLCLGAVLNYGLAHILATTREKAIVAGLFTTFRGLSPSIGAGIAGGVLQRVIERSVRSSFANHQLSHGMPVHLTPPDLALIERLKGSPTYVWQLPEGWQKQAGILAYEEAINRIFLIALCAVGIGFVTMALTIVSTTEEKVEKNVESTSSREEELPGPS